MNKETAIAIIKARIPSAQIVRATFHGWDTNPMIQVETLQDDIVETFVVRIESSNPAFGWQIIVESVEAYQLTEEEMDAGISIGSEDDSMRHCY